jgi:hypothetical protein
VGGNRYAGYCAGLVLTGYDFDPLSGSFQGVTAAPYSHNDLYSGSLLLSMPFAVNGTQGVTVNFGELSAQQFAYGNFECAVLLQNSEAAILGIVSPVATVVGTEDENRLGTRFTPLSPGVQLTVNYANAAYPESFQLGGTQFACTGNADFQGPCQGDFTSTLHSAPGHLPAALWGLRAIPTDRRRVRGATIQSNIRSTGIRHGRA